jgi:hypothetical protein
MREREQDKEQRSSTVKQLLLMLFTPNLTASYREVPVVLHPVNPELGLFNDILSSK